MRVKPFLQDNESGGKVHDFFLPEFKGRNISNLIAIWQSTGLHNQPMYSIWTPVMDFHQGSRQSRQLRKLVLPV